MPKSMNTKLHFAMFPWLAYGHMIPFLHLSNELAKRGHKVSVLLPTNAKLKLSNHNLHPDLITFHALTVPHVAGLPAGAETSADCKDSLALASALDAMQDQVRAILLANKPHFVFFDFAYWIPELASEIGCKSVYFKVISPTISALGLVVLPGSGKTLTATDLIKPPPEYPSSKVVLREHEARKVSQYVNIPGNQMTKLYQRGFSGMERCDALAMRTCREVEGTFCDYIGRHFGRQVFYTGPILPEIGEETMDNEIMNWLDKFQPGSVVFCAFGSEWHLEKDQFQELVLGFEMTGLPFLVALKAPKGTSSIEEALPEGFQERVLNRGMVCGGWVPQTQILGHKSVGCFVNHCGYGSMWEALMSDAQLVFVPNIIDQILNTRLMADELGVALEVEKDENGWICKENLCKAVRSVMDEDSHEGCLVRKNHKKWKETLSKPGFMKDYVDSFIQDLHGLLV